MASFSQTKCIVLRKACTKEAGVFGFAEAAQDRPDLLDIPIDKDTSYAQTISLTYALAEEGTR